MTKHYLDLAVSETPGAAGLSRGQTAAVREVERELKRAEPSYRKVQDYCEDIPRTEARCALAATSTRTWEACLRPPGAEGGDSVSP